MPSYANNNNGIAWFNLGVISGFPEGSQIFIICINISIPRCVSKNRAKLSKKNFSKPSLLKVRLQYISTTTVHDPLTDCLLYLGSYERQGLEYKSKDGRVTVLLIGRGLHSHPLSLCPEQRLSQLTP